MMNYNHLYYFFVTARTGSVTGAARILSLAQPSLSAQLKTLEGSMGRALFARSGRKLALTQEGEFVYGFCRKIFEPAEELEETLKTGHRRSPRIHLGVSPEIERPFVVDVIGRFMKAFPSDRPPQMTMMSDPHDELVLKLKNRLLDAVFTNQAIHEDGVTVLGERKMPVVAVYKKSAEHRVLSGADPKHLGTLSRRHSLRWVLPHRDLKLRGEINGFVDRNRVRGMLILETDALSGVVRAIEEGMGIGFLPLPYVQGALKQKRLEIIGPADGFWKHSIWLYGAKGKERQEHLQTLLRAFE